MLEHGERFYEKTGKPLFSSHMLDLSEDSVDFNLGECARILARMKPLDMSLEIELGCTGGEEDGVGSEVEEGADRFSPLHTPRGSAASIREAISSGALLRGRGFRQCPWRVQTRQRETHSVDSLRFPEIGSRTPQHGSQPA